MPIRIQRKRTRGWKMPRSAVYVGRGSKWGNPHKIGDIIREADYENNTIIRREATAEDAVWFFRQDMQGRKAEIKKELAGKNLSCWCPLDKPCHADVLLEIANSKEEKCSSN